MKMLISDLIDLEHLNILKSNADPLLIQYAEVATSARELVKTIKLLELYPSHQTLSDKFELIQEKYPSIYGHRSFYIWQMSQAAFQITSLSLAPNDYLQSNILKCQASFVSVLLDDVGDVGSNKTVLDKCILALKGQIVNDDDAFVDLYQLIAGTWSAFQVEIEQTENYTLLRPFLDNAYKEWINSFEYGLLIQTSPDARENWEKHVEIISHSSILYLAGLIDLLFVPNLSSEQIHLAIQIFLRTQKMGQIANWLTTWPRELRLRDFSSGLFGFALEKGWITPDTLQNDSLEKIEQEIRASPAESHLWNEWESLRIESHQIAQAGQLVILNGYIESFSVIMYMLLASTRLL